MESLIALPLQVLVALINIVLATATYIISFTVQMALAILGAVAPYASAALFFVSNETEDKTKLVLDTNQPKKEMVQISTPKDGEWFSQFFEKETQVEKISYKQGKLVMTFPKEERDKNHFVRVNLYSIGEAQNIASKWVN